MRVKCEECGETVILAHTFIESMKENNPIVCKDCYEGDSE